jgi:hypothetical protein
VPASRSLDRPLLPLSFGGNYNSLTQAAGRGRETMPISYFDVWNAIFNLAYEDTHNNQQGIARSLMLMIQFTSESARFNDVCGVMSDVMHSSGSSYPGLPMLQQQLENNWASISQFGTTFHRIRLHHRAGSTGSAPSSVGLTSPATWR